MLLVVLTFGRGFIHSEKIRMAYEDLLRYNIVFQVHRAPIQPWLDYAIDYDHGPCRGKKMSNL